MSCYFDTSYLVALYVPNDHTAAALRHRSRHTRQAILFTPLHRLELRTVVRQCVHGGLLTEVDVAAAVVIGLSEFVTFDQDQSALAKAEGFRAVVPS